MFTVFVALWGHTACSCSCWHGWHAHPLAQVATVSFQSNAGLSRWLLAYEAITKAAPVCTQHVSLTLCPWRTCLDIAHTIKEYPWLFLFLTYLLLWLFPSLLERKNPDRRGFVQMPPTMPVWDLLTQPVHSTISERQLSPEELRQHEKIASEHRRRLVKCTLRDSEQVKERRLIWRRRSGSLLALAQLQCTPWQRRGTMQ